MRNHLAGACLLAALVNSACDGCNNVTIKTIDLDPVDRRTGTTGFSGSMGVCFSQGSPPPSPFSPGSGQILVGFDDFFEPGTDPFPCNDIRVANFRGGVKFDLSRFKVITTASLRFNAQRSVSRQNGETTSQSPPASVATRLGLSTGPFTSAMPDDDEVTLPSTPNIDIGVTSQVRHWMDNDHPNHGFVIWGPREPPSHSSPPEDNNAKLTWYGDIVLRVLYNPKLNPNAPQ